jgi:hypothetical protein
MISPKVVWIENGDGDDDEEENDDDDSLQGPMLQNFLRQ